MSALTRACFDPIHAHSPFPLNRSLCASRVKSCPRRLGHCHSATVGADTFRHQCQAEARCQAVLTVEGRARCQAMMPIQVCQVWQGRRRELRTWTIERSGSSRGTRACTARRAGPASACPSRRRAVVPVCRAAWSVVSVVWLCGGPGVVRAAWGSRPRRASSRRTSLY